MAPTPPSDHMQRDWVRRNYRQDGGHDDDGGDRPKKKPPQPIRH
ncbi:MAG TPA: hypothetical protein VEA36_03840 [Candidatus Paceibacterota bacterium]|nr:hypothetical protein [Candidatus Paceibacterota bacterium]